MIITRILQKWLNCIFFLFFSFGTKLFYGLSISSSNSAKVFGIKLTLSILGFFSYILIITRFN
jgi:hypothetical protein